MNLIELFLTLQGQLKIYHWQTESYAQHIAFGGAYETLDGLIDTFIEVYMGKHGRIKAKENFQFSLVNHNDNCKDNLEAFVEVFTEDFSKAIDEKDVDLLSLRDDILAELNKLMYLLTLS